MDKNLYGIKNGINSIFNVFFQNQIVIIHDLIIVLEPFPYFFDGGIFFILFLIFSFFMPDVEHYLVHFFELIFCYLV